MAKILAFNDKNLKECSEALKKGGLVAFPTETVFGLGANALNNSAVEKIFEAKKRPKSDPLIVHLAHFKDAFIYTDMTHFQKKCFTILAEKFWPGPLTIIVKSSPVIAQNVTSNSGYIGIRIPDHPVALKLLKTCALPIAAPSANIFGHVSPTMADHVFTDLGEYPNLLILESNIPCRIGIESTILKIDDENNISLLRPGAISSLEIQKTLMLNNINVNIKHKRREIKQENMNEIESSGQLLTHYSPLLETFILCNKISSKPELKMDDNFLGLSVILDYNSLHKNLIDKFSAYFDLSPEGNLAEASYNLFTYLRKAEVINGAKYILLPDFSKNSDEMAIAIFDRIYRSASGKFVS